MLSQKLHGAVISIGLDEVVDSGHLGSSVS